MPVVVEVDGSLAINQEAMQKAAELLADMLPDTKAVYNALLYDMPYDQYWHDKTKGMQSSGYSFSATSSGGDYTLILVDNPFTYSFAVAQEYSAGEYLVDSNVGQSISNALTRAEQIVNDNAGLSTYDRLKAYKDAICSDVDYNYAAAEDDSTPYGNPWQLIWVFDGDNNTKVVCEGYSKAFKYLVDLSEGLNAEAIAVSGTMVGGTGAGAHMWNIVKMDDGRNYMVDVTNCDEGSIGAPYQLFVAIPDSGNVAEGYVFNTSNESVITPISYAYRSDMTSLFGEEAITLSDTSYVEGTGPEQKIDIADATVTVQAEGLIYNGRQHTPSVTVSLGGVTLARGVDYGVVYENNQNAGTATVRVEGTGRYMGECTATFEIAKKQSTITIDDYSATYQNKALEFWGNEVRTGSSGGVSYAFFADEACVQEVAASDVRNAGDYYVKAILAADQNHTAAESNVATFTINPAAITSIGTFDDVVYRGSAFEPAPSVMAGSLAVPADGYDVSYAGNVNAGTATVTVTGRGNFAGTREATFAIARAPRAVALAQASFSKAVGDAPFSLGAELSAGDGALAYSSSDEGVATVGEDGTVTVVGAGEATITASAPETGNYEAASAAAFVSVAGAPAPAAITAVALDPASFTYDGRAHVPSITVTAGGSEVPAGGYDVRYLRGGEETDDLAGAGTVTVEVTGKGNFTGSKTVTFTIAKAKVEVPKPAKLTYNGKEQAGVASGTGYTLAGTVTAMNAGSYEAMAKLEDNYAWVDGTTDAKTIPWSIAKASSSISITDQSSTYTGTAIAYTGKVNKSGSAGAVSYAYYSDAGCTKPVKAADVKAAGTYFVRATLAADANHKGATSAAAKLTVAKAASSITLAAQTTTYTGKALAYTGKVTKSGSAGAVSYTYYSDAGCTKAVKAADANYKGATSAAATLAVAKAKNPIAAKAVARTASAKTLKSKAVAIKKPSVSVSKAQGKVKYAKASGAKCLSINKTTGRVTVKKGTKKGTYKIKVKVTAAGNKNYKAGSKTVTCKVTVK